MPPTGSSSSHINAIVEALAATGSQDIEAVASILSCKRKASSPSIHEVCLSLDSITDEATLVQQCRSHNVLNRLILCPSVYDIPWRAAVAAIRSHAANTEELDLYVHDFLHNVSTVWSGKRRKRALSSSPSKRLRPGETATGVTPAKWLLRMAEAVMERTHHKTKHDQRATVATNHPERLKDLLSILSSVIHLASEFDTHLLREILDRTFIRKVIRPDCGHLLLLHLVTDIGDHMSPADWRGLQDTLQMEAALAALKALSDSDVADIVDCIIHMGADASESQTLASRKLFERWVNILLLTLGACRGNLFVNEAITTSFATLETAPFKNWLGELLKLGNNTNEKQQRPVVHALLLLAQGLEGRTETNGWKVEAFWKKVVSVASWSSESINMRNVTYATKGCFKGSSSMERLGRIVYESVTTSAGVSNEQNARCWVRFTVDALLLETDASDIYHYATVIATLLHECHSLRQELFDQLMNHGSANTGVANILALAVSILGNVASSIFASGDKLVKMLDLPMSFDEFDIFASNCSRIEALQNTLFDFVEDRLSTVYIVKHDLDGNSSSVLTQAKRGLLLLINIFETTHERVKMLDARDLLAQVLVNNNPPVPLEARTWLYEYLYERVRVEMAPRHFLDLYCRICLLRVLSFVNNKGDQFRFELAFRRSADNVVQNDDLPELFRLLLVLLRAVEPSSFDVLLHTMSRKLSNNERQGSLKMTCTMESLFHKPLLLCFSLLLQDSPAVRLNLPQYIANLQQEGFGDDRPLPATLGVRAHSRDTSDCVEAGEEARETVKLHLLLEMFLVNQTVDSDQSILSSTTEDLDSRLLAVARCFADQLQGPRQWLSHPKSAALIAASTDGFCQLLLASFNDIFNSESRALDIDLILAATVLFCEVATLSISQSQALIKPSDSIRQVPILWEVYLQIAEEKKARQLITNLEQHHLSARSSSWGNGETIDDNIRRVRSGVLQLLHSRLKFVLTDSASIFDANELNEPLGCVQRIVKRLCKNLVAVQDGQSGGLSHDLFGGFLDCIDMSLAILDEAAQKRFSTVSEDIPTFCTSQMNTILVKFPLQRPVSLRKTLFVWLWRAPKLNRSLSLAQLCSTSMAAHIAPICQDNDALTQCFAELHHVAAKKRNLRTGAPQSLTQASKSVKQRLSTGNVRIFRFPNEKMWEGAYSAVIQVTRNHWNESNKRMTGDSLNFFNSTAGLQTFFNARSDQLRVCLDGIERSVCTFKSELTVLHLPYSVKTDLSHACDAFLNCLLQAIALLSDGTNKPLNTERFEAAASCVYAWMQPSRDDLPCLVLRWQTAETNLDASCPSQPADTLHRRLEKMVAKVWDLAKVIERFLSSYDETQSMHQLEELVRDRNSGQEPVLASVKEMFLEKQKLLAKAISPSQNMMLVKKRKRRKKSRVVETQRRSSIVGKWLDIEREEGHKIARNEDFDDLDDFLIEG